MVTARSALDTELKLCGSSRESSATRTERGKAERSLVAGLETLGRGRPELHIYMFIQQSVLVYANVFVSVVPLQKKVWIAICLAILLIIIVIALVATFS